MNVADTATADTLITHQTIDDGRSYVQIGALSILADRDTLERIAAEFVAAANASTS